MHTYTTTTWFVEPLNSLKNNQQNKTPYKLPCGNQAALHDTENVLQAIKISEFMYLRKSQILKVSLQNVTVIIIKHYPQKRKGWNTIKFEEIVGEKDDWCGLELLLVSFIWWSSQEHRNLSLPPLLPLLWTTPTSCTSSAADAMYYLVHWDSSWYWGD